MLTFFCIILFLYVVAILFPIHRSLKVADKIVSQTTPYQKHLPHPDKHILVAGDSTAMGVGAANPAYSTAGRLSQFFPSADVKNIGVSGHKLQDLLPLLKEEKKNYDLILLQIGANDITYFTPHARVKKEIRQALELCKSLSPKTLLLTAGDVGSAPVFRWPLSTILKRRSNQLRQIFWEEVAYHPSVTYIDLFMDKKDSPFGKNPKNFYSADTFHLNEHGYAIWFSYIEKSLGKL